MFDAEMSTKTFSEKAQTLLSEIKLIISLFRRVTSSF